METLKNADTGRKSRDDIQGLIPVAMHICHVTGSGVLHLFSLGDATCRTVYTEPGDDAYEGLLNTGTSGRLGARKQRLGKGAAVAQSQ